MKYRLYIDESGDHSNAPEDNVGKRYLALVGVAIEQGATTRGLTRKIEELKERFWPGYDREDPPVLHREDIINRRGYFHILVNTKVQKVFDEAMLTLIRETPFISIAVVIDKYSHKHKEYRSLTHPYHYGLLAMMERYCGLLNFRGTKGDIMAEARGGKEDHALKKEYLGYFCKGGFYLRKEQVQNTMTSKEIKIKPKEANIPGLQLVDMLAHPLKCDVLQNRKRITEIRGDFAKEVVRIVTPKYNRQVYTGVIDGYGRVFLE